MKRLILLFTLLSLVLVMSAQSPIDMAISAILKNVPVREAAKNKALMQKKMFQSKDSIVLSDYMMSIDRVNDNLNTISDSSKLGFDVIRMDRRIDVITNDIALIRKNMRGRGSSFNIKNIYLYQSFTSQLNDENDRYEERTAKLFKRVNNAKLKLKTALSDSVFRKLYSNANLKRTFETKLLRVERKLNRTDSITRVNVDTLNSIKVKIADNAVNLSNMLNMMEVRLDRADNQIFGQEVNLLWKKAGTEPKIETPQTGYSGRAAANRITVTKIQSERSAIAYYISQTSSQRIVVLILGLILFLLLYIRRKLLSVIRKPDNAFEYLQFKYLNKFPAFSVLVLLLCLMPFFDAYAPTSYIAIEFCILVLFSSIIFFRKESLTFNINWILIIILFIAETFTYLFFEPTFISRLWMVILDAGTILFSLSFFRILNKERPYYKLIKMAIITSVILSVAGIFCNLFGRYSLSGIFGISAIFAVTQWLVLPVFIDTSIEILLLQLQSSRLKKGFDKPFDSALIAGKIRTPLLIIAVLLWTIMLTSNLNIYHSITKSLVNFLTTPMSIGSISFPLVSVLYFFIIIWIAHLLQQLLSFLFGETGIENEDTSPVTKKQHSRLLITRLLVLIGGYMLAIAASGLPIDKITILLGALGIGIGMGLQNIVNNFVSGIILIFDGSFKIGDEIEVSGQAGRVKEIGLRASTISTSDGAEIIIPNGNILSQNIVNWTYTNDLKRVMLTFALTGKELDANVVNEVINETIKNMPDVIPNKKPVILYTKVTQQGCTMTVRFWVTIGKADSIKSDAMLKLNAAFSEKKIQFE